MIRTRSYQIHPPVLGDNHFIPSLVHLNEIFSAKADLAKKTLRN